jgi:hypothetical protein
MRYSKAAILLATAGMSLGLIGAGLSAAFTDEGTVVQDVSIGTFGIQLSTESAGCVVNVDAHSITCTAPEISSSAPGSAPVSFTVTSTGEIPVVVNVTQSSLALPWSSLLAPPAPVTLVQGASTTYNAGLAWGELGKDELGDAVSVTYTVDAAEVA